MRKRWIVLASGVLLFLGADESAGLSMGRGAALQSDLPVNAVTIAVAPANSEAVPIVQVTDQISIAGQISESQIAELPNSDFVAVLNVRVETEDGAIPDEQLQVESLGIPYMNLPMTTATLDVALLDRVLDQIEGLPKPLLVHCSTGFRASFAVMMYQIAREGMPIDEAKAQYLELGFDFEQRPAYQALMNEYFALHSLE